MKTYTSGDHAPYGLYVATSGFDYRFVGADGEELAGVQGGRYVRLPNIATVALLPVLGAVFYFAFPVIVVGVVLFALFKFVAKPLQSVVVGKAHLAQMRWDPVMAYMKRPRTTKTDKKKNDQKK